MEENGLRLIVLMMRYRYRLTAMCTGCLIKPSVPQITRCHLYTNMVRVRMSACVKDLDLQRYVQTAAKVPYELLVSVALLASELKIAMRSDAGIACPNEHI